MRRRRRFTSVVLAEDSGRRAGFGPVETLSGSRMQPAVVSHLMEACGQDMLKDAGKKSDRIEKGIFQQRYVKRHEIWHGIPSAQRNASAAAASLAETKKPRLREQKCGSVATDFGHFLLRNLESCVRQSSKFGVAFEPRIFHDPSPRRRARPFVAERKLPQRRRAPRADPSGPSGCVRPKPPAIGESLQSRAFSRF
jgi:hypothetical protein